MDKRLHFKIEHYKQKLEDYAKDTVEFESFNELFKFKVNKNDNPTVVEAIDDYYEIYISVKPEFSFLTTRPANTDSRGAYFARVYISSHDLEINVFLKKSYKIAYTIMLLIVTAGLLIPVKNGDLGFLVFIPLLLLIGVGSRISRKLFKKFIVNFLNSI